MSQGMSSIIMIVLMFGLLYFMMIRPEKKRKQQAQQMRDGLKKGDTITTIGGIIGKVVSVDVEYEEIVIDSEGSLLRFGFNAISREYTRPAFVHDDEVDENGNPLPQDAEQDQVPMDDTIETASEPAADVEDVDVIETADTESK